MFLDPSSNLIFVARQRRLQDAGPTSSVRTGHRTPPVVSGCHPPTGPSWPALGRSSLPPGR